MEQIERLNSSCSGCAHRLHQMNELRVRGGHGGVAAQREVFVYADQHSLQVDDL